MDRETPEFFEEYQRLSHAFEYYESALRATGRAIKSDTKLDTKQVFELIAEWTDAREELYNLLRQKEEESGGEEDDLTIA